MAERKFLDFLDMFDGGGAGMSGDRFEGGGILSALGNLVASPYGSEDEARRNARMAFYDSGVQPGLPAQPTLSTQSANGTPQSVNAVPPGLPMPPVNGTPQPNYAGSGMTPANAYVGPMQSIGAVPPGLPMQSAQSITSAPQPNYAGSGMNPTNAYVDPTQRFAQDLIEMYGPDTANMILNSGMSDQAYQSYVERGYRF